MPTRDEIRNREYLREGERKLRDILNHLGDDENVSSKEYEEFIMALAGNHGFPGAEGEDAVAPIDDKVKAVLNIGLKDGDMDDEIINVSENPSTSVRDLIPTQSQIGLLDSLGYLALELDPESQKKQIPTYLNGNPGTPPIITANGKYIIDGHHRWSGVFMINPDAKMKAFDLDMSKFKDQEKMLATVQLAIASTYGALYMKNADAKSDIFNFQGSMKELVTKVLSGEFGPGKGKFENCPTFIQILAGVPDEELDLSAIGKTPEECIEIMKSKLEEYPQVIEMLTKNAELILAKKPEDAPRRVAMPQPKDTAARTGGEKKDLPSEVKDKLNSGQLNFREPITVENTKWIKTYEQFRNKK